MGASKFIDRAKDHDRLKSRVVEDLKCWGIEVLDYGVENYGLSGVSLLDDPGSKMMRMRPDIAIIFDSGTHYIDPKASRYIEKSPYEEYVSMSRRGATVLVVAEIVGFIKFKDIKDIALLQGSHSIWPVVDTWITPRAHPNYQEYKYRYPPTGKPFKGSGTPYREMIVDNSWSNWTQMELCFALSRNGE